MATPKPPKFILASASPRRLALLAQIGITPDLVMAPEIDECFRKNETPLGHVKRLAREKAEGAAKKNKGAFVLAADTIVTMGRRVLGKPADKDEAERFLLMLSGRRHKVITSVAVIYGKNKGQKTVSSSVAFKRLSALEIDWYVKSGEWQGKAGGYAIQSRAGVFIKSLNGSYTSVVGLPLYETWCLLEGLGYKGSK